MGDDIIEGKKSLLIILAIKNNPEIKEELLSILDRCSGTNNYPEAEIRRAITLITQTGAFDEARQMAGDLIRGACSSLREWLPDHPSVNLIFQLFNNIC